MLAGSEASKTIASAFCFIVESSSFILDGYPQKTRKNHYLEKSPAENCLALGIIESWRTNHAPEKMSPFAICGLELDPNGLVGAVFLQSSKATIVCGRPSTAACLDLPDLLAGLGFKPTGVVGPLGAVVDISQYWASLPGGPAIRHRSLEKIHELRTVTPPQNVLGRARLAQLQDCENLAQFVYQFALEALPQDSHSLEEIRSRARRQIELKRSWLWFDADGAAVSTASISRMLPGGAGIAMVYTPPAQRGRGYGAAVTAAVSQAILDQGGSFCCLYTDLANPTSNWVIRPLRPVDPIIAASKPERSDARR